MFDASDIICGRNNCSLLYHDITRNPKIYIYVHFSNRLKFRYGKELSKENKNCNQ